MDIKQYNVAPLSKDEKSTINGGLALLVAGFMIGWMIAHHQNPKCW